MDYNNANAAPQAQAMSWDSEITKDAQDIILLPPGEYDFIVDHIERGQYNGGDKMPPCPQADVHMKILTPDGNEVPLKTRLFLVTTQEWKLSQFFVALGLKRRGEPLRMRWDIAGMRGRCKIKNRKYNDNTYNEVDAFLEPPAAIQGQQAGTAPSPAHNPTPAGQAFGNWQGGGGWTQPTSWGQPQPAQTPKGWS